MFAQRVRHVFEHRQIGEQRTRLKQHAHFLARFIQLMARQRGNVIAIKPDFTAVRCQLTANQTQQRRFANAGRPHDRRDLATGNRQVDIFEYQSIAARERHVANFDQILCLLVHVN
ncbi:hypothetical protein D3C86_1806560 [compost metagenome]